MSSENITIGNYHILSNIASGSFGRVYLAQHSVLTTRTVALKLMHTVPLSSKQEFEQFLNEAKLLELLHHPYILPILDVGIHEGIPYIVSEYAAGNSLRTRLNNSQCSLEESLLLLSQVGQALNYAHQQNIIHRDLKPENILFNAKGDALLVDFGLATMLTTSSVKYVSNAGTPRYMAPEQCRGIVSKESDQYALGCIAYELFTGHPPFSGPDPMALMYQHVNETPIPLRTYNTHLPLHIEQAVLKALMKQRPERHSNIAAFLAALRSPAIAQPATLQTSTSTASTQVRSSENIAWAPTQMPAIVDNALPTGTSSTRSPLQTSRANKANSPIDSQELLSTFVPTDTVILSQKSEQIHTSSLASIPPFIATQQSNELLFESQRTILSSEKEIPPGISSHDYIDISSTSRRRNPAYRRLFVATASLLIVVIISGALFWIFQPSHPTKTMGRELRPVPSATSALVSSLTPTALPHTSTPITAHSSTPAHSVSTTPTLASTSQPLLTVNPSSENANTDCSYDANQGWTCPISLHNSQNTQQNLTWMASSQSTNVVGFSQTSGTLSPGQTISIKVFVSNVSCPTTLSFSFLGPDNKVTVPWHCIAPTLTANITDLTTELNGCTVTNNAFYCPEYLNVGAGSEGGLNWSSSGSEYVCDVNGCSTGQLSGNAITPSKGSIVSSANYEQITIIVPVCQHQAIKDTIIFSGPANSVTVTYSCNSSS